FFWTRTRTGCHDTSLHDALPIFQLGLPRNGPGSGAATEAAFAMLPALPDRPEIADLGCGQGASAFDLLRLTNGRVTAVDLFEPLDRKSTRLNSSHVKISYAVFCL